MVLLIISTLFYFNMFHLAPQPPDKETNEPDLPSCFLALTDWQIISRRGVADAVTTAEYHMESNPSHLKCHQIHGKYLPSGF